MHFSLLFSTGWGAGSSGTGFLVAIAVMACVLGAEIAGICILISKMLRARRAKLEQERIEEDEERNASYRNYSVLGLPLLMGAILPTVYITLNILTVLTVAAAVVFLFLLILCRACGYDFASAKRRSEETVAERTAETDEQPLYAEPASEDEVFATAAEAVPDESEEQRQYAYTEVEPDEEPLAAFAEEETEEETVEETEEETVKATDAEPVEDAEPVAEAEVSEPVAVVPAAAAPITTTTVEPLPQFADGTQPYKVVEKVVTETFKEVYTETPQPAAAPAQQSNPAADAVMEKLADFLDYELQKRKENDKAEEEKKTAAESVATFATSQTPEEEEDIEEEDEIDDEDDLEESEKGLSDREHDEDSDDEENDTEGDHFTGNERIIGFDEETGCYIVAHYRKSFEAKLIQSRPNIKKYYSELRNALLSYKGTKNRISWTADSFHNGRTPIAKINVKTRIIELYLALDPASLEGTVYRGTDVSHIKKYVDTPFRYKLRTPRKFKWAMELIQRVCEEHGLSPIDVEHVDYEEQYPFDTTENLVARGLIKEYIRQEKPATTFELDPDHVPEVPTEDESVIPANANFSWEFDNDRMVEKEPEPIPEPEPEPIPEPEPVAEPEPAPAPVQPPVTEPAPEPKPAITRETVKVTEMRYTERYYANAQPTYEQVITTVEPVAPQIVAAEATPVVESEPIEATPVAETEPIEVEAVEADATKEPAIEEAPVDVWGDLPSSAEPEAVEAEDEPEVVEEEEELFFAEEPTEELWTSDDVPAEEPEEVVEEVVEEVTEEPVEEVKEALPFRPSFYANRNYYEEETATEEAPQEEPVEEVVTEEPVEEEVVEEEAAEEEAVSAYSEAVEETPVESQPVVEPVGEPIPEPPVRRRIVNPSVAVVDICAIEEHFPQDAVIKLESLKVLGLVLPTATVLKIYASGPISKPLTVEANHFTLDAIKAISDADGDSVMIR